MAQSSQASPRQTRGALRRYGILALSVAAIAALTAPPTPALGTFVWNYTPSVPVGLYRIASSSWSRGDLVALKPSARLAEELADAGVLKSGRLLLKRIAGVPGDTVCRRGLSLFINAVETAHALEAGAHNQHLPAWTGCHLLVDGEIFLLGEHPSSFDGRYFGPSRAEDVIGRITPLFVLDQTFR